ncbi:MAG: ATP-binding protein [Cyanobacteria bacterium P01_F01_bin.150]
MSNQNSQGRNLLKWFYDLPIRRKQLLGLFTSELISVVGLVGVGTYLIVSGGRQQLIQQVKSEIAVTAIQYNIKVNQMGFGFRGQSDNAAIIEAAQLHAQGRPIPPTLQEQVWRTLNNEIAARKIEYATLVGSDLTIVASANADRTGEQFNPNDIVSAALEREQQIKTSELVRWDELMQEQPPFLESLSPQDVLIRYTATPVFNPDTGNPIGVLVSGDAVNGKFPIVKETTETLNGGYSAVYLQPGDGVFTPVAVFKEDFDDKDVVEPLRNNGSPDQEPPSTLVTEPIDPGLVGTDLLERAVRSPELVVTGRDRVGNTTYTLAAKAIVNYLGEPVGVLVRGTSENSLNALLRNNLSTQLVITLVALAADLGLAILLGFALIEPTRRLQRTAKRFAAGDLQARAEIFSKDEVGQLTETFNDMADSLVKTFHLEEQVEIQRRLNLQLQQEVAEREQAEAALQRSELQLREKNQLLEQTLKELKETQAHIIQSEKMSSLGLLVAGVAHEINNPVNFIHGNLPHVEDYAEDLLALIKAYEVDNLHPSAEVKNEIEAIDLEFIRDDLPKTVASMKVGTQRIRQIVRSLRTFSRMDEADCKDVDLHEGIDSTLLILQHRLNVKPNRPAINVIKDYADLPLVECYSGKLNQVLMNIFVNAIDAMEEGLQNLPKEQPRLELPTLVIQTRLLPGDWVEVAIADNGPGIPDAIQSQIFDPFFTTKPVGKGTGMGMAISYQIITDIHGGHLKCYSAPNQGTKFVIQIPQKQTLSRQ